METENERMTRKTIVRSEATHSGRGGQVLNMRVSGIIAGIDPMTPMIVLTISIDHPDFKDFSSVQDVLKRFHDAI